MTTPNLRQLVLDYMKAYVDDDESLAEDLLSQINHHKQSNDWYDIKRQALEENGYIN